MSYFESGGFCSMAEYKHWEGQRVVNRNIQTDKLYLLMLAMREGDPDLEAFVQPARVASTCRRLSGLYDVDMVFLDDDLQPEFSVDAAFKAGYWINPDEEVEFADSTPLRGYLRPYNDLMDQVVSKLESTPSIYKEAEIHIIG